MYGLVVFSDKSYGIYPIKKIKIIHDKSCLVKHKGSSYEAILLSTHESKETLQDLKKKEMGEAMSIKEVSVNISLSNYDLKDFSFGMEYAESGRRSTSFCNNFREDLFDLTDNYDGHTLNNGEIEHADGDSTKITCPVVVQTNSENNKIDDKIRDIENPEEIELEEPLDYQDDSFDDPHYSPNQSEESNESDLDECLQSNNDIHEIFTPNVNFAPATCAATNALVTGKSVVSPNTINRFSFDQPGSSALNANNLNIDKSRGKKGDKKMNFCFYCHKKQQKISRHLEMKHKNEDDVKLFINLTKKDPRRREFIGIIRKKGNFLYNTKEEYNQGDLIVSRRPPENRDKKAADCVACSNCRAFFSKTTIRNHFRFCTGQSSATHRSVMLLSKRVTGRIHPKASEPVRKYLFPPLRDDNIVSVIRYDELLIIFSNKMCEKYREVRYFEMIRQRLRLLGRFLVEMKNCNGDIFEFASIYDPKFIDDVMKCINLTARFNDTTSCYEAPTVAFNLSTLIKQNGNILITECIKKHDDIKKKNAEDFLKIFIQEINMNVNRTVAESQLKIKRQKKIELPSMEDIKTFRIYLLLKKNLALSEVRQNLSLGCWIKLAEVTLILIQLFNRRRAGEIERMFVEDFKNYQSIDKTTDQDLYMSLSNTNKQIAENYIRFVIRGKRNRTVPVLLDKSLLECVNVILENRGIVGVSKNNPYIFGLPGGTEKQYYYLRACNLMRKYSEECGAENPERLRGTHLRKHIATTCITLNLQENEVTDLANFMGHQDKIHKDIYRQPIVSREIINMSKLLEIAQGASNNSDSETEEYEDIGEGEELIPGSFETANKKTPEATLQTSCASRTNTRKTTPFGSVRWNSEEKKVIYTVFKTHISNGTLPSLKKVQDVINRHPVLQNRTPPQVKTWINNQHKIQKKRLSFRDDLK